MKRILSIITLTLYIWFPKTERGIAGIIWAVRDAEAKITALTPGKYIWIGDSRVHGFEKQINEMGGHVCLAVSGSKIRNWMQKAKEYAELTKPRGIIIGCGGNNFRNGEHLQDVCDERAALQEILRDYKVYWIEVTPVGIMDTDSATVNQKVFLFNEWQAREKHGKLVRVNHILAPEAFLDPQYGSGDNIHFNEKAWPVYRAAVLKEIAA